jgi:carbon storage regulator
LVLARKVGQEIVIAETIRVVILSTTGDRVRVGVEAPPSIRVDRQEVHEQRVAPCLSDAWDQARAHSYAEEQP